MKLIFTRGTFREKLFSSMLFTTLTTLMLCSSLLLIVFSSRMEDSARQEADTLISVVSSSISDLRDSTEKIGSKLNRNSLVINAMSGGGAFPQQTYYELYNATSGLRDYVQFYLYDTNGALQYSTSSAGHSRTLPTNWGILLAAASHHGELVFRGADAFSYPDRDAVLYAARSIVNNSGDAVGYFVANLSEDNLQELLEGKFGSRNTLYITDAFMRTIYCSRPAETDSPVPALRSAMLSNTPVSSDEYNYYMRHEPTSGLYIILRQPKAFTRDTTRLLRTVASFLVLGSIALCVFVSFNLSRQLSDPIGKITSAMAEVEKGSLDTRVNLHRSDELGQLADNFDNMVERLKTYMDKLIQGQRDLDEAQIRMMQAQLNPHFLYNTLDTMKWVAKANHIPEIATMAAGLAKILRTSISKRQFIYLKEELELVNCYVDIQKIRFNDKFTYSVEMEERLEECVIPKLIIQPIVENSVLHGLKESEEGNIRVRITGKDGVLCIEVTDDGCGAPKERMDAINHRRQEQLVGHIGVSNVDTIIRLTYGEEYGIHMESFTSNAENPTDGQRTEEEGEVHGTKVTLRLPVRYGEA